MDKTDDECKTLGKWRRFILRGRARALWHVHGILLWLLRRPSLRCLPLPYPAVGTVRDWDRQMSQMLEAGALSKRCVQKIRDQKLMTAEALRDCSWLRDRLGVRVAFMEDPILPGLLAARGAKGMAAKMKAAAAQEEKLKAKAIREKGEHLGAIRQLIGPRGGLPHLRGDLIKLAALLQVDVADKSAIEEIKVKVKPMIAAIVGSLPPSGQESGSSSSSTQVPKSLPKAREPPPPVQLRDQALQRIALDEIRQGVRKDMRDFLQEQDRRFQQMMNQVTSDGRTLHDLAMGDERIPHNWDDFQSLEGPGWNAEEILLPMNGWSPEEIATAMEAEEGDF